MTPNWQIRLRGEDAFICFHQDGLVLESREAQLTLGARHNRGTFELVKGLDPRGLAVLDLVAPKISIAGTRPGRIGSQALALDFDAIKKAQLVSALQVDGSQRTILSVVGEATASVLPEVSGPLSATTLSGLRLAPVGLVTSGTVVSEQRLLVARVTPAAHAIDTPDVVLSVAGIEQGGIATVFKNGVSGPIEIATELHSAAIPVNGADAGQISFPSIPLNIVIGGDAPSLDIPSVEWLLSGHQPRQQPVDDDIQASVQLVAATVDEKKNRRKAC